MNDTPHPCVGPRIRQRGRERPWSRRKCRVGTTAWRPCEALSRWRWRIRFRWELEQMSKDNPHLIDDIRQKLPLVSDPADVRRVAVAVDGADHRFQYSQACICRPAHRTLTGRFLLRANLGSTPA